ncbi:MAG: tRNA-dihydrouridine synthase family protein, partial [Bacteroidales bacterium]|nr:tRNA-dihydrouridine synthase family protein [Bacteroidales bacterium]
APIQGFTDYVYRNAHARVYGGISKYFTPFIRVEGGALRKKDINDLIYSDDFDDPGVELVPQVIANSADDMALLLDFVAESGYKACDINFGCPFPQQSKKYRGCGILQNPDMVADVLGCIGDYPDIEFSLKMRLGYESAAESMAVADIINEARLRFVTIHPRLGKQMYTGDVDMEGFRNLKNAIKHPVVYNGDVDSATRIKTLEDEFPDLHAVMIGRGIIANPGLAAAYISGDTKSFDRSKYLKFINILAEGYAIQYGNSEFMVLDKLKTFFNYSAFDKKVMKSIQKSRSVAELIGNVAIGIR